MVFSSEVFLYLFLPVVLLTCWLIRSRINAMNVFLLLASLAFYSWGEPFVVFIMLFSIFANWYLALKIEGNGSQRSFLVGGVLLNVGILGVFKYLGFLVENLNLILGTTLQVPRISLPIGISFFTFQALSYLIDVYRKQVPAQRNLMKVGLYISLFPQLVAGPIVRYQTIANQIDWRKLTRIDFVGGVERFIVGLSKKVLIADQMAQLADIYFAPGLAQIASLPSIGMWLGAIAYSFQIFFDFSGYSDMAIGLGKMFGFKFEENFNRPYLASSVSDFWRRWHMSLGGWFRDYVYIPLGGNRVSKGRLVLNLFVVWSLTGLWHGAAWTFVVWGIGYFVLLTLEKMVDWTRLPKWTGVLSRPYTLLCVLSLWVIFRAESLTFGVAYLKRMFCASGPMYDVLVAENIQSYGGWLLIAFFITFVWDLIKDRFTGESCFVKVLREAGLLTLCIASLSAISNTSYSPFIYFNF